MTRTGRSRCLIQLVAAEPTLLISYRRVLLLPAVVFAFAILARVCDSIPFVAIQIGLVGVYACLISGRFDQNDKHWSAFLIAVNLGLIIFGISVDAYHYTWWTSLKTREFWLLHLFWIYRLVFLGRVWIRTSATGPST